MRGRMSPSEAILACGEVSTLFITFSLLCASAAVCVEETRTQSGDFPPQSKTTSDTFAAGGSNGAKKLGEAGRADAVCLDNLLPGRTARPGPGSFLSYRRCLLRSPDQAEVSDRDLLRRVVATRDDTAFAGLLERHGSMVLSVCRRLLPDD